MILCKIDEAQRGERGKGAEGRGEGFAIERTLCAFALKIVPHVEPL